MRTAMPTNSHRRNCRKFAFETLKLRLVLSSSYELRIIAQTGADGITNILGGASVNDSGEVAYVASRAAGQSVFVGDGTAPATNISFGTPASNRTYFGEVQINNNGQVSAVDTISGQRLARIWDSTNPGVFTNIGRSSAPRLDTAHFDGLSGFTSISNDGQLAFAGLESPAAPAPSFWEVHLSSALVDRRDVFGSFTEVAEMGLPPSAFFRHRAADGDRVLIANRQDGQTSITLYDITGIDTSDEIASTASGNWLELGIRPGVSDDGEIIAFYGNLSTAGAAALATNSGPGVFLSYRESGTDYSTPIRVAGFGGGDGLGIDDSGNRIEFSSFDADTSVSVIHTPGGPTGIEGDDIVLAFLATPSNASRDNPAIPGVQPMLFSSQKGLWSVHLTPSKNLSGTSSVLWSNRTSPLPIVQIGDQIAGQTVTDIGVGDALAASLNTPAGTPRPFVNPGDHTAAFWVQTASGSMIVRGIKNDTDGDGLFDHWERVGGGIDIDQDGGIDLDLARLGANVLHKDMFVEIDWLQQDQPETTSDINGNGVIDVRNFAPQAEAVEFLISVFAAGPISNPDGINGITVHVDAGQSLYRNMGANPSPADLQGGDDDITEQGTGEHVHVVYMGRDGAVMFPGINDEWARPTVTRSLDSIKQNFFGTTTKNARELAFRYVVMADQIEDLSGENLGLAESPYFSATVDPANASRLLDYRSMPGNDVLLGLQGKIGAVNQMLQVPTPGSGAPTQIPEPAGYLQGQILVHEIGHTIGLLHGGSDMTTSPPPNPPKPGYRSLMNYAYTTFPDPNGVLIRSFSSTSGTGTFNDWSIVQLGTASHLDVVNNSFNLGSRFGIEDVEVFGPDDLGIADVEAIHGPLRFAPPSSVGPNADFDSDADVDGADFLSWQRGIGMTSGAGRDDGDADGDGDVDGTDLAVWRSAFGTTAMAASAVAIADGSNVDNSDMNPLAGLSLGTAFDRSRPARFTLSRRPIDPTARAVALARLSDFSATLSVERRLVPAQTTRNLRIQLR